MDPLFLLTRSLLIIEFEFFAAPLVVWSYVLTLFLNHHFVLLLHIVFFNFTTLIKVLDRELQFERRRIFDDLFPGSNSPGLDIVQRAPREAEPNKLSIVLPSFDKQNA